MCPLAVVHLNPCLQLQSDKHCDQELDNLRDQNKSLRTALSSMKQMMESMGHTIPTAISIEPAQESGILCEVQQGCVPFLGVGGGWGGYEDMIKLEK